MNTTIRVALLAACITFLAGCSNSVLSSPDSAVFDGIDPTVVSEVLENPAVHIKVEPTEAVRVQPPAVHNQAKKWYPELREGV